MEIIRSQYYFSKIDFREKILLTMRREPFILIKKAVTRFIYSIHIIRFFCKWRRLHTLKYLIELSNTIIRIV